MVSVGELLRPYAAETRRWIILTLHSSLAIEEQDKVFDAGGGRGGWGQDNVFDGKGWGGGRPRMRYVWP